MYRDPRSQFGEISAQASVVINCTHDKNDAVQRMRVEHSTDDKKKEYHIYTAEKATLDSTAIRIDRGDPVFQLGTSTVPRGNLLNGAIPVTSCLNGIFVRRKAGEHDVVLSEKQRNLRISEGIRFMGISMGTTNPAPEDGTGVGAKSQLVVRAQGTTTIFNNSETSFVPGDTAVWTLPTKSELESNARRFGRNEKKVLLRIIPLRTYLKNSVEDSFDDIMDAKTTDEYSKRITSAADEFAVEVKKCMIYSMFVTQTDPADIKKQPGEPSPKVSWASMWSYFDPNSKRCGATPQLADHNATFLRIHNRIASSLQKVKNFNERSGMNPMKTLISGFTKVQSDVERRKVGRVVSYAKPKAKVDIVVGPC